MESPEMNPYTYGQSTLTKAARVFRQMEVGTAAEPRAEAWDRTPSSHHTQHHQQMDHSTKCKNWTIKFLEEI